MTGLWSRPVLHDRSRRSRMVLLVGIDTLPASRCSTYGYPLETTPNLSGLAAQGWLFQRALSPAPWTLPAFASMLTGLPPERHNAGEHLSGGKSAWRPLPPGVDTVAERLLEAGWETRAWINNPYLHLRYGLHQGFISYVDYATQGLDEAARPGVSGVLSYLNRPLGYDRFVLLHLMAPRALVGFTRISGSGPLELELLLDGKPVPLELLRVGTADAPPQSAELVLPDGALLLTPQQLLSTEGDEGLIRIGLVEQPSEFGSSAPLEPLDPVTREQLEALGYLND